MHLSDLKRSGHAPTLFCAFLHFDISFMVWVILGALAPFISLDKAIAPHGMSAGEKGLMIAIPLLGSAFFRILFGFMSDKFGSKNVGIMSLVLTMIPLTWGWLYANTYSQMLMVGALLGIAGASFAIALPLASRWYPPQLQGLAMGIAGAGNSGTVLATLFAPMLAKTYGWHSVLGMLLLPVAVVLVIFTLFAKDAPGTMVKTTGKAYFAVLKENDALKFCLFYFVTFGGFVGLSSFLNTFYVDQFHISKAVVGLATAPFVIAGSLLRPVGGGLSDKFGGIRMLTILYASAFVCMIGVSFVLDNRLLVNCFMLVGMGALGMGNGSVFQLISQRFRGQIGAITGLVGAVGGIGGFYLNVMLGNLKVITGSYASGFLAFGVTTVVALAVLKLTSRSWSAWLGKGGIAPSHEQDAESHDELPHFGIEPGRAASTV